MAEEQAPIVEGRRTFDAPSHMRKIRTRQGMQDYLDVKWRIAWLRAECPHARIVTEQLDASETHARFKCVISLPDGGVGTGHGSETQQDFPDFYEKAETKSIGRACAVLGYGTDAAADFDDTEPMDGLPAAKSERAARSREEGPQTGPGERAEASKAAKAPKEPPPPDPSNVHQHAQLRSLAEHGFDLAAHMKPLHVESIEELTREQAKELIVAGRASSRGMGAQ
jgi:hypothetical protein